MAMQGYARYCDATLCACKCAPDPGARVRKEEKETRGCTTTGSSGGGDGLNQARQSASKRPPTRAFCVATGGWMGGGRYLAVPLRALLAHTSRCMHAVNVHASACIGRRRQQMAGGDASMAWSRWAQALPSRQARSAASQLSSSHPVRPWTRHARSTASIWQACLPPSCQPSCQQLELQCVLVRCCTAAR